MRKLTERIVAKSSAIIGAWLVFTIVASTGLLFVSISSDTRAFLTPDGDGLAQLREFEMRYTKNNNALFVMRSRDGGSIAERGTLNAIVALTERVQGLPYVTRVDSPANYTDVSGTDDDLDARALITPERIDNGEITVAKLREVGDGDPTVFGRLFARDLRTVGINALFAIPDEEGAATAAINRINESIDELVLWFEVTHSDHELHTVGMVRLMDTFARATIQDMLTLVPLALSISGLILFVQLGSIKLVVPILLVTSLSAALITGLSSYAGHVFNVATASAPVVVMVLCLAAALHLVIAIRNERRTQSDTTLCVVNGILKTAKPSLLALVTTTMGFLAFNAADAPPFRQLGNIVAVGVFIGYALMYTLLPAIYLRFGLPSVAGDSWVRRALPKFISAHQSKILWVCVAVSLGLGAGLGKLRLDDDFPRYFDSSFDYRRGVDFGEEHLSGMSLIEFDLSHPTLGQVTDPEYLRALQTFVVWLRAQSATTNVSSYADIIAQVAKSVPERAGAIPTSQAGISEYLFMYELSLAPGQALSDVLTVDRTASRVTTIVGGLTSSGIKAFAARAQERLDTQGYFPSSSPTGLNLLFSYLSSDNVRSMLIATAISTTLIALVVGGVLRRLRLGLACFIVSIVPLAVGFGAWGWLFGEVGLPGAVIVALTIGIIIDDAIHFIHKYQEGEGNHSQRVAYAVTTAGQAMVVTTVSLVCGFAVLMTSGFLVNAHLGLFTCMIVALALLFDLFALPGVLKMLNADQRHLAVGSLGTTKAVRDV